MEPKDMFLSIKRHWETGAADLAEALMQMCLMLLKAMRLHAVRGDMSDFRRFQEGILRLEERLTDSPDPKSVLIAAGELVRAFEDYNYETTRFHEVQRNELAAMMSMLTRAISSMSAAGGAAVEALGRVERRIERGASCSDLGKIKAELAICLELVREEADRHQTETCGTIQALQAGMRQSEERIAEAGSLSGGASADPLVLDPVTNLPSRPDAESALVALRGRRGMFVAVFPVDRISLIHSRFGTDAVHEILRNFVRNFQTHLLEPDQLFRWSAGAFVAIFQRDTPADTVRADIARFASAKTEYMLRHHGRDILLPLSSTWLLLPASNATAGSSLAKKIDTFLGSELHVKDSF